MRVQYVSFCIPIESHSTEEEELNRFLRGHRVLQIRKKLVVTPLCTAWAFLVEYMDGDRKSLAPDGKPVNRVDYREILSAEDFSLFSKLRELHKTVAEAQGLPLYTIFNNEQLAEMARKRPKDLSELQKIDGVGQARMEHYGEAFLSAIAGAADAPLGPAF